ncbi:arsenate reductase ArsC [Hydrogenophaga sp.]|uniref:arsenate reductase ArsC n=1 Tax=Hydrogenophaga sp. TaxID=1904254 RepID=UPI0019CD8820|nr:arsenate reductase ArsC [Hydrogenophaga sp.]MBD3892961.1 arsenate reductase ArsC [Hydrogenophaga sp.]
MQTTTPLNVLFLCTHNSARSIMAEAVLNHLGGTLLTAYSAGSSPRAHQQPNPFALQALQAAGIASAGLHSKSWDVFARPDAPRMDLVITVCDSAAAEACPYWPGQPASAHWGYPDPSHTQGSDADKLAAFQQTLLALQQRIERLLSLAPARMDRLALQQQARALAQEQP